MPYADKKNAWRDDAVARAYDERRFQSRMGRVKHGRDAHLVLELLGRGAREAPGEAPVETVLDLPTGTGRLLPDLARAGYRPLAADVSFEMMRQHAGRGGSAALWLQADGEHLPLADGAVDAVVSVRFLFHVDAAEARARVLAEMARVARRCVVGEVRFGATAKHLSRALRRHPKLRPAFDRRGLEAELERAGLRLALLRPVSRLFSDKAFFLALCP